MALASILPPHLRTRPHKFGFPSEFQASKDARNSLGRKAKKGLAYVTFTMRGQWGWVNAESREIATEIASPWL